MHRHHVGSAAGGSDRLGTCDSVLPSVELDLHQWASGDPAFQAPGPVHRRNYLAEYAFTLLGVEHRASAHLTLVGADRVDRTVAAF